MAPPSGSLAVAVNVTGAPVRGVVVPAPSQSVGAKPRPVTVMEIVAGAEVWPPALPTYVKVVVPRKSGFGVKRTVSAAWSLGPRVPAAAGGGGWSTSTG